MVNYINNKVSGQALEYACLKQIYEQLKYNRVVKIIEDENFKKIKLAYETLNTKSKVMNTISVKKAIEYILKNQVILNENTDKLEIYSQPDKAGSLGDVRDIVIKMPSKNWELGLSIKRNNFIAKHSRLNKYFDFSQKWCGFPCTDIYNNESKKIYDLLELEKQKGIKWRSLKNKNYLIFNKLLQLFGEEILRQSKKNGTIYVKKFFQNIVGKFSYCKLISMDKYNITIVQNFYFDYKLSSSESITNIPTKILGCSTNYEGGNNLVIVFNNNWIIKFQLYGHKIFVSPDLKFNIKLIKYPSSIKEKTFKWKIY